MQSDGVTLKWLLSDLVDSDGIAPYLWDAPAGQVPSQADIDTIRNSSEAKSVLVDTSDDNIDWDNLGILISVYPPPSLPEIDDQTSIISIPFTFTFTEAAGGNPQYTYIVVGQPPGITLSGLTLSGTPTVAGAYTVTVTASDERGNTDSQFFTFSVTDSTCPYCQNRATSERQVGVAFSESLRAAVSA